MLHEQNFTSFVDSYYTYCDVIIFVNSEKAEILEYIDLEQGNQI